MGGPVGLRRLVFEMTFIHLCREEKAILWQNRESGKRQPKVFVLGENTINISRLHTDEKWWIIFRGWTAVKMFHLKKGGFIKSQQS